LAAEQIYGNKALKERAFGKILRYFRAIMPHHPEWILWKIIWGNSPGLYPYISDDSDHSLARLHGGLFY